MNYLLDTHTLLWSLISVKKLSAKAKKILLNPGNQIYASAVSLWEISLKYLSGKLDLHGIKPDDLLSKIKESGFEPINLSIETAITFYRLPRKKNHDPFDRMLTWQAIKEKFILLSKDKELDEFKSAGLERVW